MAAALYLYSLAQVLAWEVDVIGHIFLEEETDALRAIPLAQVTQSISHEGEIQRKVVEDSLKSNIIGDITHLSRRMF